MWGSGNYEMVVIASLDCVHRQEGLGKVVGSNVYVLAIERHELNIESECVLQLFQHKDHEGINNWAFCILTVKMCTQSLQHIEKVFIF
jgi:hypothetical protein